MTPRMLRSEIDAIDQRIATLTEWTERLNAARPQALIDDDAWLLSVIDNGARPGEGPSRHPALAAGFDAGLPGLRAAQTEMAHLRERRPLLAEQLPSAEHVREATLQTRAYLAEIASAERVTAEAWTTFVATLEHAERAARNVASARATSRSRRLQAQQLTEDCDLDVRIQPALVVDRDEQRIAGLLGVVLRDVANHLSIDEALERELTAAREKASVATVSVSG